MEACCDWVLRLWARWGTPTTRMRETEKEAEEEAGRCVRWSRTWKLASSRHYVKAFVETGKVEGEYGWIDI